MNVDIASNVASIRQYLADNNLDAFLLPTADDHLGEYQSEDLRRVAWLSGFHGENCIVAITQNTAGIFVDGRFTVEVKQSVPGDIYDYLNITSDCHLKWAMSQVPGKGRIAVDAALFSIDAYQQAETTLSDEGYELVSLAENPVDLFWADRPQAPSGPVELFTAGGRSSTEKRQQLAQSLQQQKADATLLTQPEDTNWLLNIRGSDIPFIRVTKSYALLHSDASVDLFIDSARLPEGFAEHTGDDIRVYDVKQMAEILPKQVENRRIQLDRGQTNAWLYNLINQPGTQLKQTASICAHARVCKSDTEIAGMKAAHVQDGVAICRFLAWVDQQVEAGTEQDEASLAAKLFEFRQQNDAMVALSFPTISALGPNAAMCHYQYDPANSRKLGQDGIYLVDSGAHYNNGAGICGTTDITRTLKVGETTDDERRMVTLVLKCHIALDSSRFLPGTNGMQLDSITRQPLWKQGFNFNHGTGHGIGHFLSVHEFPPRINPNNNMGALEPGMCVTNEPGYYKEDGFGIRLENVLVTRKAEGTEADLLEFEAITYAPMDKRLLDTSLMTREEIHWLNSYHQLVWNTISPSLEGADKAWLEQACKAV